MKFRIAESREELVAAVGGADVLNSIKTSNRYSAERGHSITVKGKQVLFDPKPEIPDRQPLLVWNADRGPVLLCADEYDTLTRITPLEALLYRAGHLSLDQLNKQYNCSDCQG